MANSFHEIDKNGMRFVAKSLIALVALFFTLHSLVPFLANHLSGTRVAIQMGDWLNLASTSQAQDFPVLSNNSEEPSNEQSNEEALRSSSYISQSSILEKVPQTGKFVAADLSSMQLLTYQDGEEVARFDILSKGKPGTRWETPSGLYSISYKARNHFSSIGEVYMPYSMQFFGNFFIHGWPYYPGGSPVSEGYSGGCIRLSTEDAGTVFEFADTRTPIYVFAPEETNEPQQTNRNLDYSLPLPQIDARAYLLADIDTGEVFADSYSDIPLPIASLTKLMTSVVANETISYSSMVPVTQRAVDTYGWYGGLEAGEIINIQDMYYPLLLESSNDAATAIAGYYSESYFIKNMNDKAKALEMTDTYFADPSGLSDENVSSAEDLFRLAKYINDRKRFIFDITQTGEYSMTSSGKAKHHRFRNNNPFRVHEQFRGGKNGFTDAAMETLLSLFSVEIEGIEENVAIIVLGSPDAHKETARLLEWYHKARERAEETQPPQVANVN